MGRQAAAGKMVLLLEHCVTLDFLLAYESRKNPVVAPSLETCSISACTPHRIPSDIYFHKPGIMFVGVEGPCSIILGLKQVLSHDAKLCIWPDNCSWSCN
jgi:hypothetical protein